MCGFVPGATGIGWRMDLLERYSRQTVLPQIGKAGQEALSRARVLVLGCGALGSIQAELLARAGVGFLRIVDRDIPEWSNLPRQFLYEERDVELHTPKALAAAAHLRRINSTIIVEPHVRDVTASNAEQFLHGIDLVLDGVDNFETRYVLNDICVQRGIPWVYGGIQGLNVLAMPVLPGNGPCLQCVFPEAPPQGSVPTCDISGVLNTAPAIAASLQVTQAIRILVQGMVQVAQEPLHLVSIDPWNGRVQSIQVRRNPNCPCCAQRTFAFLKTGGVSRTVSLCGRQAVQVTPSVPASFDLAQHSQLLAHLGRVTMRKEVLEFEVESYRLLIFSDGRTIVHGTSDFSLARNLVARFLGN